MDCEGPQAPGEELQREGSGSTQETEGAAEKQDSLQEPMSRAGAWLQRLVFRDLGSRKEVTELA